MIAALMLTAACVQVHQDLPSVETPFRRPSPVKIERIIRTGQPAPDGNGTYLFSLFPPVINDQGVVAFTAFFNGTLQVNLDNEIVLFAPAAQPLIAVREGQSGPDGIGKYGSSLPGAVPPFWWPSINASAEIAVSAGIINGLPNDECVLRIATGVPGAEPEAVVRSGDPLANGHLAGNLLGNLLPINGQGSVAFRMIEVAPPRTPGGSVVEIPGVWGGQPGALDHYLTEGEQVDAVVGTASHLLFSKVTLSEDATVAFLAELDDSVGDELTGLVIGLPGDLSAPVLEGQLLGGGLRIGSSVSDPVSNSQGQLALEVQLTPTTPPFFEIGRAIVQVSEEGVVLVCKTGDPAPRGGGTIAGFVPPQMNESGELAFPVIYAWSDEGYASDMGLLRWTAEGLTSLVRTGDVLPSGHVVGHTVQPAQINAAGVVAVTVGIGPAFPTPNRTSLLAFSPQGDVREVVSAGSSLDAKQVKFVLLPAVNDVGGHRALNDHAQIAVDVLFTDLTSGIYRLTLLDG